MTDTATKPAKSRGWKRHHELRAADRAAKTAIEQGLLDELGRAPTMADRLAVEQIASLTILARTLERRGKIVAAGKVRDQIVRAQRTNGMKPEPPAPQKVDPLAAIEAHIARRRESV